MRWFHGALPLAVALLTAACASDDESSAPQGPSPYTPSPLPTLASVTLSDEQRIEPVQPVSPMADERSPSVVENLAAMLDEGLGELQVAPGEPHTAIMAPGASPPAAGANAKMLSRFVHLADFQIADDESPSRLANFDAPDLTDGAFRPQEAHLCRMLNATVRTLNRLHEDRPLDFVVLGGDNIDNAQQNELDWVLATLSGSERVECDSGADDDLLPGPDNDPKDPYVAEGLAVPWLWVMGNHDALRQGNLVVDQGAIDVSIGSEAPTGTRDWRLPGGPIVTGEVIADAGRILLPPSELLGQVAAHGDGHGVDSATAAGGKATYTWDVPGTPLRMLVIDTAGATGGSLGLIRQPELDDVLRPALDQALADGKWVMLASHHATDRLNDGSGLGGTVQADAVLEPAWIDFVGGYPNVLFSFAGHSHEHRVKLIEPSAGHAFWELRNSAIADFPHQGRVIEIWDQDNGWVMLRSTVIDFAVDDDPVAAEGRTLGAVDAVIGWGDDGRGSTSDRNVEVWIESP
jgi:hypothetical protein